jgi:hypothetical protein
MKKTLTLKCALLVTITGTLQAGIVGYNYSGTITSFHGVSVPAFAGLAIGSVVSGGFSYDDAAPSPPDPFSATYPLQSFFLQAGQFAYVTQAPQLEIDAQIGYNWELGGQAGASTFSLSLVLQDDFAPYVQTDDLLRPPPDPSTVDFHYGSLYIAHPGSEFDVPGIIFNLDRVTSCDAGQGGVSRLPACTQPSNVPEPASFALVSLCLFLIGFWRRRRWTDPLR